MSAENDTTVTETPTPAEAQAAQEAGAETAALKVLADARAAAKAESDGPAPTPSPDADGGAAATATEVPPTAASAPPPIPEPAKPDQAEVLLQRLNKLEADHRSTAAENKTLREAAARAVKLDQLIEASRNGDLTTVATELGWKPEDIVKYVEGGKEALQPTVAEKKADAVAGQVAELKQQLEMERAQRTILEFKGTISQEVAGFSKETPYLVNDFTDQDTGAVDTAGIADAIFSLQAQLYHDKSNPRNISVKEAAELLNKVRGDQLKRLQGKPATPPAPTDAAVTKPAAPATKPEPATKTRPKPATPQEADDVFLDDALAVLKSFKIKERLSGKDLEE